MSCSLLDVRSTQLGSVLKSVLLRCVLILPKHVLVLLRRVLKSVLLKCVLILPKHVLVLLRRVLKKVLKGVLILVNTWKTRANIPTQRNIRISVSGWLARDCSWYVCFGVGRGGGGRGGGGWGGGEEGGGGEGGRGMLHH